MKEIALLFKEQCVGEYSGHMSMIKNNPLLHATFAVCGYSHPNETNEGFAKVLRKMADALEDKPNG